MKKDELEELFKKSFDNYEAEVSPSVWKNIKIGLKWGSLALLFNTLLNKLGINIIVAVITSVVAIVGTFVVMNWTHKTPETGTSETTKTTLVQKTEVVVPPTVVAVDNKEQPKESISSTNELKVQPTNTAAETNKKDKKNIESVINKFSEEPIASISASPVGGTVPLIVNLVNTGKGKSNKWIFSDGKKGNSESNPVHIFEAPGVYSVILSSTTADGKTATDSIKVEVTGNSSITAVPKEFSPNGDGKLDVFVLQSKNISHMAAKIFDKTGTIMYKSDGVDAKWDGNDLQGKKAQEGIYFYLINAEGVDGKKYEQKGSVNLKR